MPIVWKNMFLDSSTIAKTFDIIVSSIFIVETNLYTFKATRFFLQLRNDCRPGEYAVENRTLPEE